MTAPAPHTDAELRAAVQAPAPTQDTVIAHPLAAWVEERFGLAVEDERLVRRQPATFEQELALLRRRTGLDEALCRQRLKDVLAAGNAAERRPGDPVFAFRLHQFLGSGSSVYATLEPPEERAQRLTMEGQFVAPSQDGRRRLLFPLAFCRECGQEYYLVSRERAPGRQGEEDDVDATAADERLIPRSPLLNAPVDDTPGTPGFFALEHDGLWSAEEALPDYWLEERKSGPRIKKAYQQHVPLPLWLLPDGAVSHSPAPGAVPGWFQPRPFMLCLRCRAAYDLRQRSDFAKLSTLSQIGRSTATTITTGGVIVELGREQVEPEAQKVLSFTDNRQDASLQAGHLNDFTQVALLRSSVRRAIEAHGSLTFAGLGQAIFDALALPVEAFMRDPRDSGPGHDKAVATLRDLLEYRAYEDLRRAWRVAQPNLEQCGLLTVDYDGLAHLAADETAWTGVPAIGAATAQRRETVLRSLLDHLRFALAIDARPLGEDAFAQLKQRTLQWLRDPWAMDEYERARLAAVALLPGVAEPPRWKGPLLRLGPLSSAGRYLRSARTWDLPRRLDDAEVEALVRAIVAALRGHVLTVLQHGGRDFGVQLKAGALRWRPGNGIQPGPDPVRARALYLRNTAVQRSRPNRYFSELYRSRARDLAGIVGREHTGQVAMDDRIQREQDFRSGKIKALFCSPTMELGVDIADLFAVHMRNVPPTPANYAQRSGRAGRNGRPALVLTFCSQGNAHDDYFFRRSGQMIAGAVAPARLDLANRDLVEAHLHSVWLSLIGLDLGRSLADLLDLDQPEYPLLADRAAQLEVSEERRREVQRAFRAVAAGADGALPPFPWLTEEWIEQTVRDTPRRFAASLRLWRELYQAAVAQRDAARRTLDRPRALAADKALAERQEREAKRELALLLNESDVTETDFYPYRYFANEGFLPGYNFPRLPLRVLVSSGDQAQSIDRPRFLGLAEFGPQNVIYHEGRKHRVAACVLPAGGIDERMTRARLCKMCGSIFPGDGASRDLCGHCGAALDAFTSDLPQHLFDQPTARAVRSTRISSDEEERSREGYVITTHVQLPEGPEVRRAEVRLSDNVLLEALYAPQTSLWRINHGWRRAGRPSGFTMDRETGRWGATEDDGADPGDEEPAARQPLTGVKPYVTDRRNVLLLRPALPAAQPEPFLVTLAFALQRAIQFVYQVEEQEVAVERIGQDAHRRLLLWEAAEGGAGVWERLLDDRRALAALAGEALRTCHFDADTGAESGDWERRCAAACYDCLLSYSNQREHRYLDRHLIRDYLLALRQAELLPVAAGRSYDAQYRWLLDRVDPASALERQLLDHLYAAKLRLPNQAQTQPAQDVAVQPDFYYERDGRPGVCVFVDGSPHDTSDQQRHDQVVREALEDRGYLVVVIRHDRPLPEQLARHADVFGEG